MRVVWPILAGVCTIMSILSYIAFRMRKKELGAAEPEDLEGLVELMVITAKTLSAVSAGAVWLALLAIVLALWI